MYKFITIRCRNCGSVIYNLPEKEIKRLKLLNLMCEDCIKHNALESYEVLKNSIEQPEQNNGNNNVKYVS
jgi:hypothetical protein